MANSKTEQQRRHHDWRWLITCGLFLGIAIIAIVLNLNHADNSINKIVTALHIDNSDAKINWNRYQTKDIELSENAITITESGTYHITGSSENNSIVISASEKDEIKLILDNINLAQDAGPVIYCRQANDLVIELVGENTIIKTTSNNNIDEDATGAIYANADLTFQGNGTLNLTSDTLDGIIGKDDIKFNGGIYNIVAEDDGIRGRDSVYITNGTFNIDVGADAIKSTNETDTGRGFVFIENGSFNLIAGAKGVKSPKTILIYAGNYILNTTDDAIHSNGDIGIAGGNINIESKDDAIHANRELIIDNGEINITRSYEGIEAQVITINNGNISIIASDDGINAGGGTNSSTINRPDANTFDADENCILSINGGNIYINSAGDGVDSNGRLYFNNGKVVIDGPINNGNGALDSGLGITMNGGEVIAVGSSGMAETLGTNSNINNISVYFDTQQPADTIVEIKNSREETILSHVSAKPFSYLAAGTNKFNFGESYTIYINNQKYQDFTINNITTTIGNNHTNHNMAPPARK